MKRSYSILLIPGINDIYANRIPYCVATYHLSPRGIQVLVYNLSECKTISFNNKYAKKIKHPDNKNQVQYKMLVLT
ncbi:hypothetical protein QWZ16_13835 [Vibrio ostreicida]|uniref:Uncharacterized protein n=1 Tax=Vibrio ostreicida TaxID=526588 RepID=A0ABT8BVG9_9VIBR|nr:hypothetical protein [Vibrio ostreicida]MDN3610782.1 hypothetical protein [Vibrio ostreicida]